MTNEEKAQQIANEYGYWDDRDIDCSVKIAIEMAEWKDAQLDEELNLIADWFKHIAQMADDKKTLTGFVMKDSDAFDEIKCLAKRCAEYVDKRFLNI